MGGKFAWAAILVWGAVLSASACCEPTDMFLCRGKWDGQGEAFWSFNCGDRTMVLRLHPNRCQFVLEGKPLGWSELIPLQSTSTVDLSLCRNKFRWSLMGGRRLIAFAFAELPPTVDWAGQGIEALQPMPTVSEGSFAPLGKWRQVELEDGSTAFSLTEPVRREVFPLTLQDALLTDFSATLPVQPNGARSVGLGVCWGDDGGYLWRWVRLRGETMWQLAVAKPSGESEGQEAKEGWELVTLYEEPASVPPVSWHQLQIWRSGDQLWAGVDGKVLAQVQDNRFGWGRVVVWVESGDLPQPLVKPVKLARWWCATLSPDVEAYDPFPALHGQWQKRPDGWTLKAAAKRPSALALLGTPDLPSWWVADVSWLGEPVGLVFGWLNEKHYHLLRLRPLKGATAAPIPQTALELVAVRDGREKVLDEWTILLEREKLYRLAVKLTENRAAGFVNGLNLVSAEVSPVGKVGLWAASSLTLHRFWLYAGEEPLVFLTPEDGGVVHPASEQPFIAHEVVSLTLPAGLPPNVPVTAKLSQEPVTLFVERQGARLILRLERQNQLLGVNSVRLPSQPPITIRMERRDRLLLIWLDNHPVWTLRLP